MIIGWPACRSPRSRSVSSAWKHVAGVFPQLWRGETVSNDALGLDGASLGPLGIGPPPIVVGGTSARVLAEHLSGLIADRPVERQVQLWLREVGLDGAREARDRYEDAGADTLLFVLDDERDPDVISRLASAVLSR